MEFDINSFSQILLSALAGGGLTQIVNWRINRKKAKAEVKQSEIEVIAETVKTVYQPIIEQQNKRIAELDHEVKELRDEKRKMQTEYELQIKDLRDEYSKQITALEKRLLEVSRAVGLKTAKQARATKKRSSGTSKGTNGEAENA